VVGGAVAGVGATVVAGSTGTVGTVGTTEGCGAGTLEAVVDTFDGE